MVREDDRTVILSVRGTDARECRLYFDKLRSTLNDLFKEYKILKPQLYYRVVSDNEENTQLWMSEADLMGYFRHNREYFDPKTGEIHNVRNYVQNFYITNSNLSNCSLNFDNKMISFQDCTLSLQGDLNDLVEILKHNDAKEEAIKVADIASSLENQGKNIEPNELRKNNIPKKIEHIINEILDEGSRTNKIVKKAKHGIEIVKNIIESYNKMANQLGFPAIDIMSQLKSFFL